MFKKARERFIQYLKPTKLNDMTICTYIYISSALLMPRILSHFSFIFALSGPKLLPLLPTPREI